MARKHGRAKIVAAPSGRYLDDRHIRSASSDTHLLAGGQSRSRISTATNATATTFIPIRVLALDPKTGKLKWYYQFTPHDVHDWDAQEPPVLVDADWQGQPRKLLLQANRNGFFYVLDRPTANSYWPSRS